MKKMFLKIHALLLIGAFSAIAQQPSPQGEPPNAQSGTTYTFLATDCGRLVTLTNGSSIAGTLPIATATGFGVGCWIDVVDLGAGTATITPTTSTINGASTYVLATNQGVRIVSDGTNYQVQPGKSSNAGANTALSNLSVVSINTALLPQTSIDLGSTTEPFRNLFLYGSDTYGTDYLEVTGTPTGARVITLPDATGTLLYSGGPLGTPSGGTLTNGTGLPLTTGVTGVLPIANGGTNTGSTLTGIVRGGSSYSAAELSGDCTTSGSNVATCASLNTQTFSATPAFNLSLGIVQTITLTANVTSSSFTNGIAGKRYTFIICQNATGNFTFAWGAGWHGPMTIGSTPSLCSTQDFAALNSTTLYGVPGSTNE